MRGVLKSEQLECFDMECFEVCLKSEQQHGNEYGNKELATQIYHER